MVAEAKLEDANLNVYVRFRPINKNEKERWKESNLSRKLADAGLDGFIESFRCDKKFRNPKTWHKYMDNSKKNNQVLHKLGLQEGHQRMFRKFLRTYTVEELDGENMDEAVPFKLFEEENQLEVCHPVTKEIKSYSYDDILWWNVNQMEAFKRVAYKTVEGVLSGINGTIFAYGQSGTGKTFSLVGPEPLKTAKTAQYGILPFSVHYIFHWIGQNKDIVKSEVVVSFLEIYLEQLKDLIEPPIDGKVSKKLKILEMAEGEFRLFMAEKESPAAYRKMKMAQRKRKKKKKEEVIIVQNLSEHRIQNAKDFVTLCIQANDNRSKSETNLNASSSRSHMICQVQLKISKLDGTQTVSKLNIVDLAGSEKISKTQVKGSALSEAKSINASLSTLRNVIDGLAKGRKHVPFRDSKLSMILKDSLGGNTRTSLLIAVSPHKWNFDESVLSLEFGKKAKFIENKVQVNVHLDERQILQKLQSRDTEVRKLKKILEATKKELGMMENKVKDLEAAKKLAEEAVQSTQPEVFLMDPGRSMRPRHSIVEMLDKSEGRRESNDSRCSLRTIKENLQGRVRAGSRARTGSRVRAASRVRTLSTFNSTKRGPEAKLKTMNEKLVKANREMVKMKKANERFMKLEKERQEELKEAKETEKMAVETMDKYTDLKTENQVLLEKLKKSDKNLTDLKASTLTQSESDKIIQDLEVQLMEKANQLQREREARGKLENSSPSKSVGSQSDKIIQELETKLMEKSNELQKEKENRARAEDEVKKLMTRIEDEKKDREIGGNLTREHTLFDLSNIAQQVYEEKAEEKARVETEALKLAMDLMKQADQEHKKKKKDKKRRKKRRKHADSTGDLQNVETTEEDGRRRRPRNRKSGLPKRSTLERNSELGVEDEKIPPLTMAELTSLSEGILNSLALLTQGERPEHILKVWIMMMLSIIEEEDKGKHKLIPLSQYFSYHSELNKNEQTSMLIVKVFGVLDNTGNGYISSQELTTYFKQVREVDALKWGWYDSNLEEEMSLGFLIELLEVSFFISREKFMELDVDKDGWISIYDLITYLKEKGGRKWWNVGKDYSDDAIVEVLMRVHRMKWGQEFAGMLSEEIDENEPPPVDEEEFNWYLVQHSIGSAFVEITDEFLSSKPVDKDRYNVFKHIVPGWRRIFHIYSNPRAKKDRGLTTEGAQAIVKYFRSSGDDEHPEVTEDDHALVYLKGLMPDQMEMMVRACPEKIWETLVDPSHQEVVADLEEEFQDLKQAIAEAVVLMSSETVDDEEEEKSGEEEVYVSVKYDDDEDDAPWRKNNNMDNYEHEEVSDDPDFGQKSWV